MNCVLLSKTTGPELDSYDVHSASLLSTSIEDSYATAPILVVTSPVDHHYEEEELHTSFEQAISDRVSALQGRLSRLSAPQSVLLPYDIDPMVRAAVTPLVQDAATTKPLDIASIIMRLHHISLPGGLQQRGIRLVSLALSFAMLGFDLMGLLVLHMR
jgi:hypothetical protein